MIIPLKSLRKKFSAFEEVIELNNLLNIQKESYYYFLQRSYKKEMSGLHRVFNEIFPIETTILPKNKKVKLVYKDYFIGINKLEIDQIKQQGLTLSVPIVIKIDLLLKNNSKTHDSCEDYTFIDEYLLYLNNIPLMTNKGTFIVNGIEKVLISQLQRSPGIYYTSNNEGNQENLQLIPHQGSWLNLQINKQNILFINFNKRIYLPIILFLLALEVNKEEILKLYFNVIEYQKENNIFQLNFELTKIKNKLVTQDIKDFKTKEVILEKGSVISEKFLNKLKNSKIIKYELTQDLISQYLAENYYIIGITYKPKFNIVHITQSISPNKNYSNKFDKIIIIHPKDIKDHWKLNFLKELLQFDNISSDRAKLLIYKLIEPSNSSIGHKEKLFFNDTFFNKKYYDLSRIGRKIFNNKFGFNFNETTLKKEDLLYLIKHFFNIKDNNININTTDLNQLPNRRVRSTGELLENLYNDSLSVVRINIIQKFNQLNIKNLKNRQKILSIFDFTLLRVNTQYFFNNSSLSQFVDQVNVLSELTNKRRITLLGLDGLSQESTTLDNRDTYSSYYGRLCPIETPEGHNVGLVNTFSVYSKITDYGLVLTPYKVIEKENITNKVFYVSSEIEPTKHIGQYNENKNHINSLVNHYIYNRFKDNYDLHDKNTLDLIDVSSKQILSISSSLIPFLEHNDASRALMGANMQRQAVPLVLNEYPLVGTGAEGILTSKSNYNITSLNDAKVVYVDNSYILTINSNKNNWKKDIYKNLGLCDNTFFKGSINKFINLYKLTKFEKSNQNTLINYKPSVSEGNLLNQGDIIAEGITSNQGDLSLGNNLLAAYMSFGGQSFEDSIAISEEVLKKNLLTSIHLETFDIIEMRHQDELEVFTGNLPSIGDKYLSHLNTDGIVKLGSKVKQGDILVGKIKIKLDTNKIKKEEFQNINDLIINIKDSMKFNNNVLDTSFKLPKGKEGFITKVTKFYKNNNINSPVNAINSTKKLDYSNFYEIIQNHFVFKTIYSLLVNSNSVKFLEKNLVLKKPFHWPSIYKELFVINSNIQKVYKLFKVFLNLKNVLNINSLLLKLKENKDTKKYSFKNVRNIFSLPLKMVRIEITYKHQIKPGDKITGRYGNKGIISQVLPIEDMPYLPDGTPIDIILNPISISSRMNFGQILETHLAWASVNIAKQIELLLKNKTNDNTYQDVKNLIYSIYNSNEQILNFKRLNNAELIEKFNLFTEGIPLKVSNFDSPNNIELNNFLKIANLKSNGQSYLREGKTGELFNRKVTVGYIYTLKLNHFVDSKIHARSIGPYNLISKQPLIGKAHSGGQRFGEMEVWALQGYGAAYTLQEILTVKSDSYTAKETLLHLISENQDNLTKIIPQSFHLLIRELWSLGLFVDLH